MLPAKQLICMYTTASCILNKINKKWPRRNVETQRDQILWYSKERDSIQFLGAPKFTLPGLFQLDAHGSGEFSGEPFFCIGGNQLEEEKREEERETRFPLRAYICLKIHCLALIGYN